MIRLSKPDLFVYVNSSEKLKGDTLPIKFVGYVSPYLVVTNGGRYTKHIYAGTQRIASKLGDIDAFGADPRRVAKAGHDVDGVDEIDFGTKYKNQNDAFKARFDSLGAKFNGKSLDDYVNGKSFCCSGNSLDEIEKNNTQTAENAKIEDNLYFYHPDHLGSTSMVTNYDGDVTQNVAYIPYGEVFVEERNGSWTTPFLFNAKELDEETGLYYYGARYLDPTDCRWLAVDPVFHPGSSPYAYCLNNPIKLVDPDGRDTITVSEKGLVSKVKESKGDNVFLDCKGKTLTFNDKENVDKKKSNQKYEVGDRVYMNMSYSEAFDAIKNVPQNEEIKDGGISRYWNISEASHGNADFAVTFLDKFYENNRDPEFEASKIVYEHGTFRMRYEEDFIYFRFEGTNILYNFYDSGNFMWGAWSKHVDITDSESQWGPKLNEILHGRLSGDSNADTRAIKQGRLWIK